MSGTASVNYWHGATKPHVRRWLLRFSRKDLYLAGTNKHAIQWLAREIGDALDRAIILSLWLEELDADPFAWREGGRTTKSDDSLAC